MKIAGLQKTSLIDYPGKIACVIFTHGCNFRCGFCHNPELVIEPPRGEISGVEFFDFLEKRKGKLDGVCITGGEPLLDLDKEFLREIKSKGFSLKLDTNGSFPEKLRELLNENLVDFIAMDIKADRENYDKVTNVNVNLKKIEESILIVASSPEYEFRTTVVGGIHTKENMEDLAIWLNGLLGHKPKKFILQGFKNSGKLIDVQFKMKKDVSENFLKEIKDYIKGYFEDVEIRV
jgi:pyruvate formate lyase activating enzyme